MTSKAKIKVIKKGELKQTQKPMVVAEKVEQESARVMVSNVTNWVQDFQHRKREETRQAIEKFFTSTPQASGA